MTKATVLIMGGDDQLRSRLKAPLLGQTRELIESRDQRVALRMLRNKPIDLVIIGSEVDGAWDGSALIQQIRRFERELPIILVVKDSSEDKAVAAFRAGANDYFRDAFNVQELAASVQRCLAEQARCTSSLIGGTTAPTPAAFPQILGDSPSMRAIRKAIGNLAATDSSVLITGETGTGKELVAELVHLRSARQRQPLIRINCAAIPDTLLESELFGYEKGAFTGAETVSEGKLRLAAGGTTFFDEIGDMSPFGQAKILRAIESKEVYRLGGRTSVRLDVRIMAATNQDLDRLVSEGRFRRDLYFRLDVARIHLPPLRDRSEDIPALLNHYVQVFNRRFKREIDGFTEEARQYLVAYDWPGNVRELRNVLEAVFVTLPSGKISFLDLPEQFRRRLADTKSLTRSERDRLVSTLLAVKWNKSRAAETLHWSRMTLYRKMAKYQITKGESVDHAPTPC